MDFLASTLRGRGKGSMSFATGLKTIVVATDLDGRSEAALEYARKLASAYGARIVLAHGLDPLDYAAVDAVPGRVLKRLAGRGARSSGPDDRRPDSGRNSQPLGDSPGRGGADAGGCGPAVRGRADRDRDRGQDKARDRSWWAPSPSNWCVWRRARCWRWRRTGMPDHSGPRPAARCCWPWRGTRRRRQRWPRRARWRRRFSARCWCFMRAVRPKSAAF